MVAGSWQEMLLAGVAMAPQERPRAGYVLARLTGFASRRGIPAVPEYLLDYDVIEAFCVRGLAGRASATRGTCRSVLYRLAAAAQGPPGMRATPFAAAKAPVPYSANERAELAAVAVAQRDPAAGQRTANIVFAPAAPEIPHVYVDGPTDSPHRYSNGSLCMWYPDDPSERRWTRRDGAATLLGHVVAHLIREEWWRRTGEWAGAEAPH